MEVDICNEGNPDPFLYFGDRPGRFFIHDSDPDDFAACLFEKPDLTHVFPISLVSVLVIDWTEIGASLPILTGPIQSDVSFLRGRIMGSYEVRGSELKVH